MAPPLVLYRADNRITDPEHGRYMAGSIPGARFVNLPGADVEARQALVVLPVERGVGQPGGRWLAIGRCARTVVARIASTLRTCRG